MKISSDLHFSRGFTDELPVSFSLSISQVAFIVLTVSLSWKIHTKKNEQIMLILA